MIILFYLGNFFQNFPKLELGMQFSHKNSYPNRTSCSDFRPLDNYNWANAEVVVVVIAVVVEVAVRVHIPNNAIVVSRPKPE